MGVAMSGEAEKMKELVDRCLSEYDLEGWKAPGYTNPDDVNLFRNRR